MTFWVHSFRARRERDYEVVCRGERDIAMAVLAGWRFVLETKLHDGQLWRTEALWRAFDQYGNDHGTNNSREQAAAYALGTMEATVRQCRHGHPLPDSVSWCRVCG